MVLIDTKMPPKYLPFWSFQDKVELYNLSGHEAILSLQFDQLSLTHLTFTRCISTTPKHWWLWNRYKLCVLTLIQNPLTLCTIYWYYRYSDLIYHKFSCPAKTESIQPALLKICSPVIYHVRFLSLNCLIKDMIIPNTLLNLSPLLPSG